MNKTWIGKLISFIIGLICGALIVFGYGKIFGNENSGNRPNFSDGNFPSRSFSGGEMRDFGNGDFDKSKKTDLSEDFEKSDFTSGKLEKNENIGYTEEDIYFGETEKDEKSSDEKII